MDQPLPRVEEMKRLLSFLASREALSSALKGIDSSAAGILTRIIDSAALFRADVAHRRLLRVKPTVFLSRDRG